MEKCKKCGKVLPAPYEGDEKINPCLECWTKESKVWGTHPLHAQEVEHINRDIRLVPSTGDF